MVVSNTTTLFCKISKKKLISKFQLIFYEGEIFAFAMESGMGRGGIYQAGMPTVFKILILKSIIFILNKL